MLPVPSRGITLRPPWSVAVLRLGKRIENRSDEDAKRLGTWRGTIAITQTKAWDADVAHVKARTAAQRGWLKPGDLEMLEDENQWRAWAGKLIAVAELIDIREPGMYDGDKWYIRESWGFILGRVWEVEPVTIMGAHHVWFTSFCSSCRLLQAVEGRLRCRRCKQKIESMAWQPQEWQPQELRIVRECLP